MPQSPGIELIEIDAYLKATLDGDSTIISNAPGLAWRSLADDGTPTPFTIFNWQGGKGDSITVNGRRIFTRVVYKVEAVGPIENYAAIAATAGRIDALFALVRNAFTANANIYAIKRTQAISRDEMVKGFRWAHLGGLFELEVQMK